MICGLYLSRLEINNEKMPKGASITASDVLGIGPLIHLNDSCFLFFFFFATADIK